MTSGGDGTDPSHRGRHRGLDGLRGLAVLAVVLYHFAPDLVPGGFLGVDVFFVLSGFLITTLLLEELERHRSVSLRNFWTRRARRLLPAALSVILVSVALAWWLEPESSRAALRTQSLASLLYVNNWSAIASGSSYQARFGGDPPLQHFWSLAVEEQFYLLFPVVVVGIILLFRGRRDTRSVAKTIMIAATLGAIASAVVMSVLHIPDTDPSRVYLGSDTRAHALLIGVALSCAMFLASRRPALGRVHDAVGMTAILLLVIAFALVTFTQNWLYRGGLFGIAILTALMIWYIVTSPEHLLSRALQHPLLVRLGLVSYGLYLWHWPVRVFVTPSRTGLSGPSLLVLRIVLTALATWISAVVIERPFRRHRPGTRPHLSLRQTVATFTACLTVGLACLVLTAGDPPAGSLSVATPPPSSSASGTGGPIKVLLIGDSVAWTLGGGDLAFPPPTTYVSPFDPTEVNLWNRATFGMSLLRLPKRHADRVEDDCPTCEPRNDWSESVLRFRPDLVVFSAVLKDTYDVQVDGRWIAFGTDEFDRIYLAALEGLRNQMQAAGVPLVILLQPRPGPYPPEWSDENAANSSTYPHLGMLQRRFAAEHPDVAVIDLDAEMCPRDHCATDDGEGHALRTDGLHFSPDGARALSSTLSAHLRVIVAESAATRVSGG